MIALLRQLDAATACMLPDDADGAHSLQLLEWPRVTAQIAGCCLCRRAAEGVAARRPYIELAPIELRWRLADELRTAGDQGRWPPIVEVSDLLDWLEVAGPFRLDGPALVHVAAVAAGLDELALYFAREGEATPIWSAAAAVQERFDHLVGSIRRALDRDGRLLDGASPLLGRLRSAVRKQERDARAAAERALAGARQAGLSAGPEVTLRGDRYCLPLRAAARRRVDGIVHDRSASGGTVYVEPAEVVELTNRLVELRLETAAEEARILMELNRAVEAAAPGLREACALMLTVDETRAALLWSRLRHGQRPILSSQGRLRVCRARHPLLEAAAGREEAVWPAGAGGIAPAGSAEPADACAGVTGVVPLDLDLPHERRVLLISGPNAGGKSVALKTVGVCVLLAQCGWDVPAREDTILPLVRRLCVDFGDEQSITMSLSSFSAHLGHLGRFLATSGEGSLVLCDEIGGGTDPEEGTALAFAVLDGLAARGALVLASTHFGLLKAAVHDHPQMINAAMDFDQQQLRPLFTLRLGVPGASHAFAIAARCGLPVELLTRARGLVGEERFQIERLLAELGTRARCLAEEEARARELTEAARRREDELAARLAALARERDELLARTRQDGERLLQESRRAVEAAVREIRSGGAAAAQIRDAHAVLRELAANLEVRTSPAGADAGAGDDTGRPDRAPIRAGDRVRIPRLALEGEVLEVRGDRLVAQARGLRLTLPVSDVEPLATQSVTAGGGAPPAAGSIGPPASALTRAATREIDLRGQRAEEAWDQLDLLLDRAIPAGLGEILVIHGIGTGRLRAYLHERLAADPRVGSWELAPSGSGGAGATIVRLADS